MHYHQGMVAGENTLNAVCTRLVMRGITAERGAYSSQRFLADYVKFMTTPGPRPQHRAAAAVVVAPALAR